MNILFYLTRYPGCGGIETVTSQIIGQLAQNMTHNIDVISHWQQEQKGNICARNIFPMPNKKQWAAKENIEFALEVVANGHYDVIIYQDSYAPTEKIVCRLSREYKIPLIVFEHNSPLYIYNKRDLSSWLTPKGMLRRLLHVPLLKRDINRKKLLLESSCRYVLLSEAYIPEFCGLVGVKSDDKVTYINNPVITPPINTDRLGYKENVLLYVGRLVVEKGVDKMLKIWAENSGKLPDWKFVIVGDGPERDHLENMSERMQLKNVSFEGFQDPRSYYERARLFIMTSKYEGWPLTLCEAMAEGVVPIVLNSFSAAQDIVKDGVNGYLASDEDVCGQRLLQLATNSRQLSDMSVRAVESTAKYSMPNIILQWETLIKNCK